MTCRKPGGIKSVLGFCKDCGCFLGKGGAVEEGWVPSSRGEVLSYELRIGDAKDGQGGWKDGWKLHGGSRVCCDGILLERGLTVFFPLSLLVQAFYRGDVGGKGADELVGGGFYDE